MLKATLVKGPLPLVLAAAGAVLAVVGCFIAGGPPRLTLTNAGLVMEYPWARGAGALLAAAGAVLVAASSGRRALRIVAAAGAIALGLFGADRLLYRLEVRQNALALRALVGSTQIPWETVARVESGPAMVLVTSRSDDQIRVRTFFFGPDQQASLERAITRHVHQVQQRTTDRPAR